MNFETVLFGAAFISPKLDGETKNFINLFSKTRHCLRTDKYMAEDNTNAVDSQGNISIAPISGLLSANGTMSGQPEHTHWCFWEAVDSQIVWNGSDKFYQPEKWLKYLIDHFLKQDCLASLSAKTDERHKYFQNFGGYSCEGYFLVQGESIDDAFEIFIEDNRVFKRSLSSNRTDIESTLKLEQNAEINKNDFVCKRIIAKIGKNKIDEDGLNNLGFDIKMANGYLFLTNPQERDFKIDLDELKKISTNFQLFFEKPLSLEDNSPGSLILKERVYFRSGSWKNKSHYFLGKKKEEVFSNFTDEEKVMIEENILNKTIPLNNVLKVKKLKI